MAEQKHPLTPPTYLGGLVEKFKGLETKEKCLVIISLITALGFILPWVDVPLVGSFNAFHGWLIIVFLLSLATAELVLYGKRKYALIGTFAVGGCLLIKLFELFFNQSPPFSCFGFIDCIKHYLSTSIEQLNVHGLGIAISVIFDFEIFNFLKLGFYVTYIGAIAMIYFAIKLLKK